MKKEELKELVDFIYESHEKVTFPLLLRKVEEMGVKTSGAFDFTSASIPNCIYWRNLSKEIVTGLHDMDKLFQVTLQPYGYHNEGIILYKENFPDNPIFNFLLMEKLSKKNREKFMNLPYLMPVYWVKTSDAKYIKKKK